jgi:hypothetical protein
MSNANFAPMYDLERLDADQKSQYYRDACSFLGIPANLNLLAFINANVGDTGRHEVLYAKKGATDFIRESRGITTLSLQAIPNFVPGQVCFVASGRDKNGRDEYAVGAASIDGLTGKALSDAIMTAQTRATRRMTLQFVGGGILDESELPEGLLTTPLSSVNAEATRALDAITTQPVVSPNATASVVDPPMLWTRPGCIDSLPPSHDPNAARVLEPTPGEKISEYHDYRSMTETFNPTSAQKAAQDALSKVSTDVLMKQAGEKVALLTPQERKDFVAALSTTETFKDIKDLAATLPAGNPLAQAVAPAPEAPRQRKRKPADEPQTHGEGLNASNPLASYAKEIGVPVSPSADIPAVSPVADTPTLPAQPVEPPKVQKKLKPEEEKEIRARLGKYRNEILPAGKMEPIANVGGVEVQLRTFVQKFYPDKPSSKTWDYADWAYLLNYFDETVKNSGAEGLVQVMQKKIGVRA